MGKYKKLEIQGLFFEDFTSKFDSTLNSTINKLNLSDKQIVDKVSPILDKLISGYEETISSFYLEKHKFKIDNFLDSHFNNIKNIVENNKESFTAFILYINACVLVYNKVVKNTERKRVDLTLKLNLSLYGLILRRAQEIVDLLIGGYIDGAMIIWRSMYENAISLLILALEDNIELSQRFFDHSIRNSRRKVVSYNENYKALKFKPLPVNIHAFLESEKNKLTSQYGKEFLENDYGWADILFKGKANFKLLEDKVEMNRFRPYYVLCSEQIHSNFNGFKNFMKGNKIILPRFLKQEIELKAFIDPMQFTIGILHEVNNYIIWQFSRQEERNVNLLFLKKIFEKLQRSFDKKASS